MDEMRVKVSLKRGAPELDQLSRSFPGLRFTGLMYWEDLNLDTDEGRDRVHIDVIGSGDDLARHGFLNLEQSEAIAKCKARKVFWDEQGACIEVRRNTSGFRVSRKVDLGPVAASLTPHVWSPKAPLVR